MEYISTGRIIKEFRERRKISQLELCDGLCEPPTLSKIETGKQNPNKKLLDALTARLNIPLSLNIPVTRIEFERAQIEREILSKISAGKFEISDLIEQYMMDGKPMDRLERQFYLYAVSVTKSRFHFDYENALENLLEAIKITFPVYDIGKSIDKHLLIPIEIVILNNIAICLYNLHRNGEAVDLMKQLLLCLENNFLEKEEYIRKFPMIAHNLSHWLALDRKYDEALDIIEKGIKCSLNYGRFSIYTRLLYNKGYTLLCLKKTEEGKKYLQKSLFAMKIFNETKILNDMEQDIISSFGKKFWNELQVMELF